MDKPPQSRPYRSKRHRPCDVCRRRKHGCFVDQQLPCRACRHLGIECSFNNAPRKRNTNSSTDDPAAATVASTTRRKTVDSSNAGRDTRQSATSSAGSSNSDSSPRYTRDVQQRLTSPASSRNTLQRLAPVGIADGQEHLQIARGADIASIPFRGTDAESQMSLLAPLAQDDFWLPASSLLDPNLGLFQPLSEDFVVTGVADQTRAASSAHLGDHLATPPPGDPPHDVSAWSEPCENQHPARRREDDAFRSSTETVRPLDVDRGSSAQYSILAGEVDPYLLRRMRFKDEGTCNFSRFRFRCVASEEGSDMASLPVHFLVSENVPSAATTEERTELYRLIPPELGARLIGLFLRYVFPSLPIISRTNLHLKPETLIPPSATLDTMPPGLLAAIFALAGAYRRYDPVLCVTQADSVFPTAALWALATASVTRELSTSQMHVLQTILLYIQRSVDDTTVTTTDTPGDWSLLGCAVNIAKSLGLHVDCVDWPIPRWEKRLRRRLWWIVHSEATFRSILRGLPRLIHSDDWDVSPLNESDFKMGSDSAEETMLHEMGPAHSGPCPYCHLGYDFKYLASLSLIAYEVNHALYSVSAVKKLGRDFSATAAAVRPLMRRLDEWRSSLPLQLTQRGDSDISSRPYFHSGSGAHLKLAATALEVMVHRALLRPLGGDLSDTTVPWMGGNVPEPADGRFHHYVDDGSTTARASSDPTRSCLEVAKRALAFTQGLSSYDRNSFAYSWVSACFATTSNFILLLVVQAPSARATRESLTVLVRWIMILRDQAVTFSFIRLGLLRLDSVLWVGLENAFHFPAHVRQTLQNEHLSGTMNGGGQMPA